MARWMLVSLAFAALGCSWSRFDDAEKNTPVVLLKKPDRMKAGFGVSVAGARLDDRSRVIIGGASGKNPAAVFDLGTDTNPIVDATDTGSCSQADNVKCYLADHPAGLAIADVGGREDEKLCFVLGIGKADGSKNDGLIGRCEDTTEYTLPVPENVLQKLIKDEVYFQDAMAPLALSTDKDDAAALAAGAPDQKLAWFYRPKSTGPIELLPPGDKDESYGKTTAIARLDGGASRIVAVGAPEASHVWLFSGANGKPVGCLGGPAKFGRAIATGHVDADDFDDLVIADESRVTVFSGAAFASLAPSSDITCSLAALPEGAIITSFGCGSRDTITGCGAGFATSLEVGDLDGDGDGEVLVGAPDMKVRGTANAGAVLVYDAEGEHPELLSDQLFLSSRESGDGLGATLVAAHLKDRDVVVAGAAGSGRAAVFYCSALLEGGGGRCE